MLTAAIGCCQSRSTGCTSTDGLFLRLRCASINAGKRGQFARTASTTVTVGAVRRRGCRCAGCKQPAQTHTHNETQIRDRTRIGGDLGTGGSSSSHIWVAGRRCLFLPQCVQCGPKIGAVCFVRLKFMKYCPIFKPISPSESEEHL